MSLTVGQISAIRQSIAPLMIETVLTDDVVKRLAALDEYRLLRAMMLISVYMKDECLPRIESHIHIKGLGDRSSGAVTVIGKP